MFETSIHTNTSIFEDLKDEWLELLSRSATSYIFQTPQFLSAWWETLGEGTLQIITVRNEDNTLIGLAPLYIHQEELCFVGCVNVSDCLDVLVDKDYIQEVFAELANTIKEKISWQKIFLCSLPEDSPTRNWLKNTFVAAQEAQQDVSPAIELPQTWDEYLASIDRKQRHEIKRKMRRVSEAAHKFEVIESEEEALPAIETFISLHKASSAEKRDFWDDAHLSFFRNFIPAAGKAGWLRLFFLKIDNTRTAAMLVFDFNNQYLLYNSGFDPNAFKNLSTGNVLTAYTIQQAIENKKSVYDFLRGDEEYKFRFGATAKPVFDITIAA